MKLENLEHVDFEEFQQNFDTYFERVENGEVFILTVGEDEKEKAVIMPYSDYEEMQQLIKGNNNKL